MRNMVRARREGGGWIDWWTAGAGMDGQLPGTGGKGDRGGGDGSDYVAGSRF